MFYIIFTKELIYNQLIFMLEIINFYIILIFDQVIMLLMDIHLSILFILKVKKLINLKLDRL